MTDVKYPYLLSPGKIGDYATPNRILMAPMTRFRITTEGVPEPANVIYFSQRATAGLMVTESLYVEPRGLQETVTSGIYSPEQIKGWRAVTDGVHAKGGRIFAQLAHAGRLSHPDLQPGNELPIAPSAVCDGVMVRLPNPETGEIEYHPTVLPRIMETEEVREMVKEYGRAAERAIEAGFDGIELHAGSGHLHRQFLQASSNHREDDYGGSAHKRCRFILETLEEITARIGSARVGIKIAPNFAYNGMTGTHEETMETYPILCGELARFDLAYVHVQNPSWNLLFGEPDYKPVEHIRSLYSKTMLAGGEYDRHTGEAELRAGNADFIVYGRRFITNPDLPRRIALDAEENSSDDMSIYLPGGEEGFIDFPTLEEATAKA